jgi:hypothetical protein
MGIEELLNAVLNDDEAIAPPGYLETMAQVSRLPFSV